MHVYHKIAVAAIACFLSVSLTSAAIPAGYTGVPYCCDTLQGHYQQIPGQVVCVFFDSGGEGVAFHYPGGCGGGGTMRLNKAGQVIQADAPLCMQQYSGNDYDMITDQHEAGYWHLAWIDSNGQWNKYSIHVNTAGMYYISFHQATAYYPNCEVLTYYDGAKTKIDSIINLPVVTVPPGCPELWHSWTMNNNVDSVMLDTGLQVVQITFLLGSWNLDWMSFNLQYPTQAGHVTPFQAAKPDFMKVMPLENTLNVYLDLKQSGKTSFSIMDSRGRLVGNPVTKSLAAGPQSQNLPLGRLGPGVYFLEMEHSGILAQSRFMITR